MKRNTSNILITSFATVLAFLSVTYMSCSKKTELSPTSCENHVCVNGGYCSQGVCQCPVGYSDATCSTPANAKFAGSWAVTETVTESNVPGVTGTVKSYNIINNVFATPSSFLMNGLTGNTRFTNISCDIYSTDSYKFDILSYTPSFDGNYHINYGQGVMDKSGATINVTYYVNFREANGTINNNTIQAVFTKR